MSATSRFPLRLVGGNAHPALARELAHELDAPLLPVEIGAFADGETRIHIEGELRGAAIAIVQPTCSPVNEHLLVLALLADAARAAGAVEVTAIVPYFGYARQEQRARPGDPRSAQVAGRLLACVGIDRLVIVDLHAPALESAFPMPTTLLQAEDLFLPRIKSWELRNPVVVSPDAGGMKRAQRLARSLGAPIAVVAKQRSGPDEAHALQVLGDVSGRPCLVVDDMASTGRTLAGAAEALRKAGSGELHAVVTHPVMAPGAAERLAAAGFTRFLTTDSVPVAPRPWMEIVSVAPMLAEAVRPASEKAMHNAKPDIAAEYSHLNG